MTRQIKLNDKCEYPECEQAAIELAYSRKKDMVLKCCNIHSYMVVDETYPEYTEYCSNCGCNLPIN